MTFTVYGLRLKGDRELRYIGQTNSDPAWRLHFHSKHNRQSSLREWLDANGDAVEAVTLASAETRSDALARERELIAQHLGRGDRLLNRRSLPAEYYPLKEWAA